MNIIKRVLNSKKVGWLVTIIGMCFTGFPPEDESLRDSIK